MFVSGSICRTHSGNISGSGSGNGSERQQHKMHVRKGLSQSSYRTTSSLWSSLLQSKACEQDIKRCDEPIRLMTESFAMLHVPLEKTVLCCGARSQGQTIDGFCQGHAIPGSVGLLSGCRSRVNVQIKMNLDQPRFMVPLYSVHPPWLCSN